MPGQRAEDIGRELAKTTKAQSDASDPAASAWVSANAGTGKTHVLTRRVMRLLLAGTRPDRILCLTYTKAAAAEMSTRVFRELGFWATYSDARLAGRLAEVLGRDATAEEAARARTLFASAIETPGGLKVQTIHSFSERLLQRFPLEAGVPPGFTILDDTTARSLLREAIDETLARATRQPSSPLGAALRLAVTYAADDGFDEVLSEALSQRDALEFVMRFTGEGAAEAGYDDPVRRIEPHYRTALGIRSSATAESIDDELAGVVSTAFARQAADVLARGAKTDVRLGEELAAAAAATDATTRIRALRDAFLTKDGNARSDRFITKAVREKEPGLADVLAAARDRFAALTTERMAIDTLAATLALIRIADAVLDRYSKLKARRAALDFDDLIRRAARLLSVGGAAPWVLYKLDGGLDHILVDESQDTSPEQWRIIEALAAEFFSGSSNHEMQPTLFAVGDEKQSIYSFQGARPEEFARMGAAFEAQAKAARAAWRRIPLHLSFRTVAPVLEAVDRVFENTARTPGLTATSDGVVHIASRVGEAGHVEIWDTEKHDGDDAIDVWRPAEEEGGTSPVRRLANRIAESIQRMLDGGERLASENRAIEPGDVLILVRKRNPFVQPMVAALKARKIPVAGADRLDINRQLAVRDLVSLGDFLTLPEDDLALAVVLKSPLIGFDDDLLLEIAHARKGSLWKALLDKRGARPAFAAAAARLSDWRRRADFMPPYEFLASLLDKDGMRSAILARLGPEAADSLDELMSLAISYDDGAPPSLTGFLAWLREARREIKRDMEHGRNEVRIMTVHGAKGLEAPIVFLPDTCTTRSAGKRPALHTLALPSGPADMPPLFVWQIKGSKDLPAVAGARAMRERRDQEELNRLLYVAMTRARDRLYVAGYESKRPRPPACWYDLVRSGLGERMSAAKDWAGRELLVLSSEQTAAAKARGATGANAHPAEPPPPWASLPAPREPHLTMPLAPSRLAPYETDETGEPVSGPTGAAADPSVEPPSAPARALAADNRFLRGTLTHALLQHLPGLPRERWSEAARGFVARRGGGLSTAAARSIVKETLAILGAPEFSELFGPASRAEVAISAEIPRPSGRGPALRITGQIDRLAVTADTVFIIDYKTNRPPPTAVAGIAEAYLFQLAAYRLALAEMFPGKALRAAILWTDGPRLMPIPDEYIAGFERRLWALDPANLDVT
ncbi:MAG: double-strand break repair helicase AddA [Hyphomicrobiaceae bacterium]|nr:double-strand break repair helicase AddA [Hyphomicrobiaceae bacterium]